jgi:hypothetical protein
MPSIFSTSSTSPAKKKVSPGDRVAAKLSSDVVERHVDDDAGVHPVLLDEARMRDPPGAIARARQPLELVVRPQGIAAILDEAQHLPEQRVGEAGIGRRAAHFGEQGRLLERRRASAGHDVLGEHIERAGAEQLGVELALADRVQRGARLQIFEAVARDEDRLAGLVEAVVGAADPLEQPR